MDPMKIATIVDLPLPSLVKKSRTTLGHTCYHPKFFRGYAEIIAPMEKLLKKDVNIQLKEEWQKSLDVLKEKIVSTPIPIFLNYIK